jgi:hypothetical protein
MHATYTASGDVACVIFAEREHGKTVEVLPGVILDLDPHGLANAIEFVYASKTFSASRVLSN